MPEWIRVAPDGQVDRVIDVPTRNTTNCTVGGKDLNILYVTTAASSHAGDRRAGSLFAYVRRVRHENWCLRHCVVALQAAKFRCQSCGRYFRQQFPGIQPLQRSSEAFQRMIFRQHLDGINRSRLGRREGIGAASVERYFRRGLERQFGEWHSARCPQVLGIDEHFFTRRSGYATPLPGPVTLSACAYRS